MKQEKFTSEVAKHQNSLQKVYIDAEKVYILAEKVYIFKKKVYVLDKKVYIIYQKSDKKFTSFIRKVKKSLLSVNHCKPM